MNLKGFNFMAKSKIVTPSSLSIGNTPIIGAKTYDSAPKIVDVKPVGTQILIEILSQQEMSGTTIELSKNSDLKYTPQGYIVAVGPAFKADQWGSRSETLKNEASFHMRD